MSASDDRHQAKYLKRLWITATKQLLPTGFSFQAVDDMTRQERVQQIQRLQQLLSGKVKLKLHLHRYPVGPE